MQLATHAEPIWPDLARRMLERAKRMTAPVEVKSWAIPAVALVVGWLSAAMYYGISHGVTADETKQQVVDLRSDMKQQVSDTRLDMNKGFADLASQISGLPKQSAQLDQAIQQIGSLTTRLSEDEARITATDRAAYTASETASELAKMVDQLRQQMNAPVPLRTTR